MPNRIESAHAARLLPLAAAILFATAIPAAAQQSEPTVMQRIFGAIGILEIPEDPIEYRERAPLVVPPSQALIAPRSAEDIAKANPDWPVDADRNKKGKSDPEAERKSEEEFRSGRALTPAELRGNVKKSAAAKKGPSGPGVPDVETAQQALSPTELGFKGWAAGKKKEEERVVFTGEPERRSLTDPPPGLRTPSQDAPYGIVATRPTAAKASTLYDRVEPNQGK